MKASKLMKGDLVLKLCKGGHYMPVMVLGVIDNVVDCQARDGERCSIGENGIEPIPLEKIHLTKNGFKVREYSDDTEYFYHDGYKINIDFNEGLPADNIPPTIYLSIDFAEKDIAMPIEYVHELQQAMRIMGCNKVIKL